MQANPFRPVGRIGVGFAYPVRPARLTTVRLNEHGCAAERPQLSRPAQRQKPNVRRRGIAEHLITSFAAHFCQVATEGFLTIAAQCVHIGAANTLIRAPLTRWFGSRSRTCLVGCAGRRPAMHVG